MSKFFKILAVVGAVSAWAEKALLDQKIDAAEAIELAMMVCSALGVKAEIKME